MPADPSLGQSASTTRCDAKRSPEHEKPCKCWGSESLMHKARTAPGRNVIFLSRGVLTPRRPSPITPLVDDASASGASTDNDP